jgi:hypothetical protein
MRLRLLALCCALTLTIGCKAIVGADTDEAEGYAKEFVAKNFPGQEVISIECQNADSDDNGYVSCTVSIKGKDGEPKLLALECAATWPYEGRWAMNGCRVPKVGQ